MHPAAPLPPDPERAPGGGGAHPAAGLDYERLVFFSDAVFAIAITLLALEVRLPALRGDPASGLLQALADLLPDIAAYALSFLVVGVFWVGHHRVFRFVAGYDYTLVWLNVLFLLGVAFVPVPSRVIAEYGDTAAATVFYAGCLLVVALLEYAVWAYAARGRRLLRPEATPGVVRYLGLRILALAAVFALSLPLVLVSPYLAQASWALAPVALGALRRRFPQEHHLRG